MISRLYYRDFQSFLQQFCPVIFPTEISNTFTVYISSECGRLHQDIQTNYDNFTTNYLPQQANTNYDKMFLQTVAILLKTKMKINYKLHQISMKTCCSFP